MKYLNEIVCGDVREILQEIPVGCVDCCITSPPYWWKKLIVDNMAA